MLTPAMSVLVILLSLLAMTGLFLGPLAAAGLPIVLSTPDTLFVALFIFRYLRLVVHIISFLLYTPTPIPEKPSYSAADCTVIVPTVNPLDPDFNECITSILAANPAAIFVITAGYRKLRLAQQVCAKLSPKIKVLATKIASKREQVALAIPKVRTKFTVLGDDHVFWPSTRFLPTMLAPFEDPTVGCVGMNKRVRRFNNGYSKIDFWNFIGCLYLERHNFEITATNNIDGGVFVISGRTVVHRTEILNDPAFLAGFTNERFFFGKFGPLNADDDNFITRWEVSKGWKIRVQNCPDATIETTLGTWPKFGDQCLRWVRTTWRSNSASLFTDRTVWRSQPWCVYAVYLSSFFNFALFTDASLLILLGQSSYASPLTFLLLVLWIIASKAVKIIPHFLRNPRDLFWFPGQIAFGYIHSLYKLYAGLNFYNCVWSGRNLSEDPDTPEQERSIDDANAAIDNDSGYASTTASSHDLYGKLPLDLAAIDLRERNQSKRRSSDEE